MWTACGESGRHACQCCCCCFSLLVLVSFFPWTVSRMWRAAAVGGGGLWGKVGGMEVVEVPLWHAAAGASWCLCVPLHLFIGHPSQPGLPTFLSNSSQTDRVLVQTNLLFISGKKWGKMGGFLFGVPEYRTIWHRGPFSLTWKKSMVSNWTIWHQGQFGTLDNLAPGQFGTRTIWHPNEKRTIWNLWQFGTVMIRGQIGT